MDMKKILLLSLSLTTARINGYTISYYDCSTPKSTKIYDLNNLCKPSIDNNATKLSYQLCKYKHRKNKIKRGKYEI